MPEGQGFFATSGTSFFATSGTGFFATSGTGGAAARPHGDRVVAELQELQRRYGRGRNIEIVPVDTAGFTTSVITQRITQTINQLATAHPGANFVVNMSFAVIPCDQLATLAIYDALMHEANSQLAGDLTALQEIFNSMMASGVFSGSPRSGDEFSSFFTQNCDRRGRCRSAGSVVIPVAAAGNSSAPFPFYPAAWSGSRQRQRQR